VLVAFTAPTSDQAVAKSLSSAPETSTALAAANWSLIADIAEGPATAARDALVKDELTEALVVRLKAAEAEATRLATQRPAVSTVAAADPPVQPPKPTTPVDNEPPVDGANRTSHVVSSIDELDAVVAEVRTAVEGGATVTIDWSATD